MKKLLCLLVFASSACWAGNQIEFDFGRGSPESYVQANGSRDPQGSRGTDWSLNIFHQTAGTIYVGLGGGYFHSNKYLSPTFAPNTVTGIRSHATDVLLLSRLDLGSNAKFLPYLLVGGGWVKNSIFANAENGDPLIDESKSTYGYAVGGGFDVGLTDRLIIGLEARYQACPNQHFDLTSDGRALTGQTDTLTRSKIFFLGLKAGIKY